MFSGFTGAKPIRRMARRLIDPLICSLGLLIGWLNGGLIGRRD